MAGSFISISSLQVKFFCERDGSRCTIDAVGGNLSLFFSFFFVVSDICSGFYRRLIPPTVAILCLFSVLRLL